MSDPSASNTCAVCGQEINPDVCWCGTEIALHSASMGCPCIPWGCDCHRAADDASGERYSAITIEERRAAVGSVVRMVRGEKA